MLGQLAVWEKKRLICRQGQTHNLPNRSLRVEGGDSGMSELFLNLRFFFGGGESRLDKKVEKPRGKEFPDKKSWKLSHL